MTALLTASCATNAGDRSADDRAAELAFLNREPLHSCGEVTLEQDDLQIPEDAVACMDATLGSGAELKVTMPTTEGDPIVPYYRVGPGVDGLEIYSDNRADAFRGTDWDLQRCPGTTTIAEPQACVSVVWGQ